LLKAMDLQGISISTGSACNSRSKASSHVLAAMGIPEALAQSAIRFSIGRTNTRDDIQDTVEALIAVLNRLR